MRVVTVAVVAVVVMPTVWMRSSRRTPRFTQVRRRGWLAPWRSQWLLRPPLFHRRPRYRCRAAVHKRSVLQPPGVRRRRRCWRRIGSLCRLLSPRRLGPWQAVAAEAFLHRWHRHPFYLYCLPRHPRRCQPAPRLPSQRQRSRLFPLHHRLHHRLLTRCVTHYKRCGKP